MPSFVDNQKRTWVVDVTFGSIKRVRGMLDINLAELKEGTPPLITRLGTDIMLLVDVIFALIKPQADKLNVTDEQWAESMGGEAMGKAMEAFYEAMTDFFQKSGRTDTATAMQKQKAMIVAFVAAGKAKIDAFNVEEEVASVFGDSDLNLPEPAE